MRKETNGYSNGTVYHYNPADFIVNLGRLGARLAVLARHDQAVYVGGHD
jgi:hypothetical protein